MNSTTSPSKKSLYTHSQWINSQIDSKIVTTHSVVTTKPIYKEDKVCTRKSKFFDNINDGIFPALSLAAQTGDKVTVERLLITKANVDGHPKTFADTSPLYLACKNGHEDIVELLITNGAKLNKKNSFGQTNLHIVSSLGYTNIVKLLLENGANPNVIDSAGCSFFNYGSTPLHIACQNGHEEIVKLLIGHGADIKIQDSHGKTALNYAFYKYPSIVNCFEPQNIEALKEQLQPNKDNFDRKYPVSTSSTLP